jgi:hypothetical protein
MCFLNNCQSLDLEKGEVNMRTPQRLGTIWPSMVAILLLLGGCATSQTRPAAVGETFITASHATKPEWVTKKPTSTNDYDYYVGRSEETVASERDARQFALDDAHRQVALAASSRVKTNMERAGLSTGLSGAVVDPTVIIKTYDRVFAAYVSSGIKDIETYWERWQVSTGVGYKLYTLVSVPKKSVDQSIMKLANMNLEKAQQDAKAATTEAAKKQADDTIKYWKRLVEEGMLE